LWINFLSAQTFIGFAADGFNVSSFQMANGAAPLDLAFHSVDQPGSIYILRLSAVYEGVLSNGRIVPKTLLNMIATGMQYTTTYAPPTATTPTHSFTMNAVNAAAPTATNGLVSFSTSNTYYTKASPTNICPDLNGRFCIKTKITLDYTQMGVINTPIIFVWQLLANQVTATATNPFAGTTTPQVLNNLGFLTIETNSQLSDKNTPTVNPIGSPVTMEIRTDNFTSNGIWVIYNLGTTVNSHVVHDPIFGINNGLTLTVQIVTTALAVGIVLAFLIILGCSIYIYHGNTKGYYRKLRQGEESE